MSKASLSVKERLFNVIEYCLAIILIFDFRSFWSRSENYSFISGNSIALVLISIGLLCIIYSNKSKRKRFIQCIYIIILLTVYLLSFMLLSRSSTEMTLRFILYIDVLILYQCFCSKNKKFSLLQKLDRIICLIAIVSLFFWVFGSILGIVHPTGTVITDWTGMEGVKRSVKTYYNLYFEPHSYSIFGVKIVKNSGIFTEGPMASFVFVTALLYELYLAENKNIKTIALLCVAIVSTISTTGYLITIIAFMISYLQTKRRGVFQTIKILILPIMLIVGIVAFSSVLETKLSSVSGSIRMDDFSAGFKAWMDSPLWGNGIGNSNSFQQYMSSFRSFNLGFSNSLMNILAFGGIMLFLPYLFAFAYIIKRSANNRNYHLLAFFILFFTMFLITLAPFQALIVYIFIACIDSCNDTCIHMPKANKKVSF